MAVPTKNHCGSSSLIGKSQAAAKREAAEEELRASAGFAHVFGMLLASGKPAVGHNCMLDLLHAMRAFHGPLPATWDEFQRTTADAFTGGLYDTKHMARQHDAVRPLVECDRS